MQGTVGFAVFISLFALVEAGPTWAANDPKDLESQNANDAEVFQSTGQANLRIEIAVPKGTGGSEPDLALSYSSILVDGPFGVGWRVELGEIQRSARFGTPAYDDTLDEFEFDGVLLVKHPDQANHPGEYRTFQESFARITRTVTGADDYWVVEFPNGRKARFGTNQETRVRRGGDTHPQDDDGVIGRWLLSEVEDANGNVTRFSYDRGIDVGTAYPKEISYSYRGGSQTPVGGTERKIEFILEDRDDPILGFPVGLETRIVKRVAEIRSLVGGAIYRRLVLGYAAVDEYTTTGRTRLTSTQLFGSDCDPVGVDPETSCNGLPRKTFSYTDTSPAIPDEPEAQWENHVWAGDPSLSFTLPNGISRGVQIGDINGDGFLDFVQAWRKDSAADQFRVYLGEGSGWGSQSAEWTAALMSLTVSAYEIKEIREGGAGGVTCGIEEPTQVEKNVFFRFDNPYSSNEISPMIEARLIDLNADGFSDIILSFEIGAGSVSAAAPCAVAPDSWGAAPQVSHVWINQGRADPDGPSDPNFGWVEDEAWAASLPPFYSIYLWSDAGSGDSRPGWVFPPGDNRMQLVSQNSTQGTAAYYFDHGVRMPDLNGDGRPDIVAKRGPANFGLVDPVVTFPEGVWLSRADGIGWDHYSGSTSPYLPPEPIVVEFGYRIENPKFVLDADTGVRFADVNGDGLADLIKTHAAAVQSPYAQFQHQPLPAAFFQEGVWLNTGDGWCGPGDPRCNSVAQGYLPTAVNAGGFTEVYPGCTSLTQKGDPVSQPCKNHAGVRGTELRFVDLNGDGLVDLLKTDDPGFGGLDAWIHDPSDPAIWKQDPRFVPDDVMATIRKLKGVAASSGYQIWDSGVRIFDFDGDATVDLLRDVATVARKMFISKTSYIDLIEKFDNGQGGIQQYGYGSAIAQRDSALEAYAESDAMASGEAGAIGMPRWTARAVVTGLTKTDSLVGGTTHTTALKYAMPQWDPESRTQLGFRAVEATHDDGSKNRTFFWQEFGRAGRASRILNLDEQGALMRETTSTWEVIPGSEGEGSIAGVHIGRVIREQAANYFGSAGNEVAGSTQTITYAYADPAGNSYGYSFVYEIETTRPTGVLTTERFPEPAVIDPDHWIVGQIGKQIDRDGSGDVLGETEFDYVGTLPTLVRKTVKKRHGNSGATFAEIQNEYDEYGNLVKRTDPIGRTTFLCYDGDIEFGDASPCPDEMSTGSHTVVVGVKDPLGGVTRFGRDLGSGMATELVRLYSGDAESIDLDPFGRPKKRWAQPDGHADKKILVERNYVDDPIAAGRPYVEEWNYFKESASTDPTAAVRTAVYLDGFGREMVAVAPSPPGHTHPFGRATTQRDHAGRPLRETLDIACSDADCSNIATYPGMEVITQTYDALGRILTRTTPDGVIRFSFGQRAEVFPVGSDTENAVSRDVVLEMDAKGNLTEKVFDGDRLVVANECSNVVEDPAAVDLSGVTCGNPDSTYYTYEASGELDTIFDAHPDQDYVSAARRMRYRYDTLGRQWYVMDPDAGTTETTYDLAGNVLETLDARNRLIGYEYDGLNRLTVINTPGGLGDWSQLVISYDSKTRKRSRVTATGMTYSESWEYDDFAFLSNHKRSVIGRTLRTDFDFDLLGRLTKLQSPVRSDEGVSYVYEGAYLTKVCSELDVSTSCETSPWLYYVEGVEYDALGRITTVSNPDLIGDSTYTYYDINDSLGGRGVNRLKSIALDDSRLNLAYTYDANGMISRIEDGHAGDSLDATGDYFYDQRNRLSHWMNASGAEEHFAYDAIGNLVGRNLSAAPGGVGDWNQIYDSSNKPHAIRMNWKDKGYNYDAAGNVVQRGGEYLTYNSFGQVHCVGDSEGSCSGGFFWYDIDGNLMSKSIGAKSEIYLGNYFRFDKSANIAWTYTSAFGKRIVMERKDGARLRYALAPPIWSLPIEADLFFQLLVGAGLLGALGVLAWLGAFGTVVDRPVSASIALVLIALIAAPPQAWGMGKRGVGGRGVGGGGGNTYTRFLFYDHLGNNVLALNEDGVVVERRIFEPFGEVVASQIDTAAGAFAAFTGKNYHDELSLYNFGARWYDAEAGRFVSVDPVVQFVSDPQTHNPYGYVRNNPIVLTDPDGRVIDAFAILAAIGAVIQYATSAYFAYDTIRSAVERLTTGSSRIAGPQQGGPRDNAAVTQNTLTVSGQPSGKRAGSTAKNYGGQFKNGGVEGFFSENRIQQLHKMAQDANATASFIVGGGAKLAGFGAVTVDADGNVSFNFGIGVGGGELSVVSLTAQGEVQGGEMGAIRLEFMIGGAVGGGAMQRASVSLTSVGAAVGGGFVVGQGGFVFAGPSFSIPLGNILDLFPEGEAAQ